MNYNIDDLLNEKEAVVREQILDLARKPDAITTYLSLKGVPPSQQVKIMLKLAKLVAGDDFKKIFGEFEK